MESLIGPVAGALFGGGDSPSAPSGPDPIATARAQGRENRISMIADALLNRTNQYNPWYSVTYENDPNSMAASVYASHNKDRGGNQSSPTPKAQAQPEYLPGVDPETSQPIRNPLYQPGADPGGAGTDATSTDSGLFDDPDLRDVASHAQVMRLSQPMLDNQNARQGMLMALGKELMPGLNWGNLDSYGFKNQGPASRGSELPNI